MRNVITSCIILCAAFSQAQQTEKCAAQHLYAKQYASDPERYNRLEDKVAHFIEANKTSATKSGAKILTIPVVFHVVYNPTQSGANISEDVLRSQIDVLNEDFRRLNADANNTREPFKALAADIQVEFQLATVGPDGLPTTGINRRASLQNFNVFTFENYVKFDSLGGINAWPADSYLNIWTCDMSLIATQFVIGYAQFPGGDPATDGIVLEWEFVGRKPGNTTSSGRTATHEVGHWLGLRHIWGDGDCTASDFVDDTPKAAGSNSVCSNVNSCDMEDAFWNGQNPPDMVENYMDYTSDFCLNAFTMGQKMRMFGFLNSDSTRAKLFESEGLGPKSSTSIASATKNSIQIYPNPVVNELTIEIDTKAVITISHITGSSVSKTTTTAGKSTLNVSQLNAGIYLISVEGEDGEMVRKRFVKE